MENNLKFKSLVHYVCDKCNDNDSLGAIKLNKILWLSDVLTYINEGQPITSERYVKRQFGPVPAHILKALDELQSEGVLQVNKTNFHGWPKTKYTSLKHPSIEGFTPDQIALVDDMINIVCNDHTAMSISNLSHTDIWEVAEIGEDLPHYTMFMCESGEIDEADIEWAKNIELVAA